MATVSNLGSEEIEHRLRERMEAELKDHTGIRASVVGSHENDNWEVKVENSKTGKQAVRVITPSDGQTVEDAMDDVKAGIKEVTS